MRTDVISCYMRSFCAQRANKRITMELYCGRRQWAYFEPTNPVLSGLRTVCLKWSGTLLSVAVANRQQKGLRGVKSFRQTVEAATTRRITVLQLATYLILVSFSRLNRECTTLCQDIGIVTEIFMYFFRPSSQISGQCLNLIHGCFFVQLFQFMTNHPIIWRCIILNNW